MERLLANRAVEDTPEELVRRLREPLPEPPPAFVPALFGEVDPQRVADLIAALPVRERLLFTLRFHDHLTLAEIGDVFGISRERVRQIESNVIQKMRQVLGAGSE